MIPASGLAGTVDQFIEAETFGRFVRHAGESSIEFFAVPVRNGDGPGILGQAVPEFGDEGELLLGGQVLDVEGWDSRGPPAPRPAAPDLASPPECRPRYCTIETANLLDTLGPRGA